MPVLEALLSLIGPAYLAYYGFAVPVIVVWAILCAGLWVWNNRPSKRQNGVARSRSRRPDGLRPCRRLLHRGAYGRVSLARHLAGLWA
ncbi:conserved hypothetical protein [Mesorhizobium sp. ORS 3359]|nr:conserved hypothetical protein [Mesorhizobium sp. ORS 3359]